MKVTQGVLKLCSVYGITFENKYSDTKTYETINDFKSTYSKTSKTATILTNNKHNYNIVDECDLINCNVENGHFINTTLVCLSGNTNYINDGYFTGCTISGYTINGGHFYNCDININNIWNFGTWESDENGFDFRGVWKGGVWNKGNFNNANGWKGGTFNGGTFSPPAVWYDGIANGGTFSGITWHNGLVRYARFINCEWMNGIFNDGIILNSIWEDGNFNGGEMYNTIINGGDFYNGKFEDCTVNNDTNLEGGRWTNILFNNGKIFNIDGYNLTVIDGDFHSGKYYNSLFTGGDIFNGIFFNVSGSTSGLTIHNGDFHNSVFNNIKVKYGTFNNCYSKEIVWDDGVYTEGKMYNSTWYNGYWNDGIFGTDQNFDSTKSNTIIVDSLGCELTGNIDCLCLMEGFVNCDY